MSVLEEAVSLVLNASQKFGGAELINRQRLSCLKPITDHITRLAKENDGDAVDMEVDEVNKTFILSVEIPDLVCQNAGDEFVHELVL